MEIVDIGYIKTDNKERLRNLISNIVTDFELDVSDVFAWFKEDNTGDIQVYCSDWAIGALEEAEMIIKDNLDAGEYDIEDLKMLNELIDICIKAKENGYKTLLINEN